ncbi:MAG: HK97 family phage prohead protease [Patescibacteria group bacterium]|nr:HK97 family phage prohead protease [Patescibacteria group bacterium]
MNNNFKRKAIETELKDIDSKGLIKVAIVNFGSKDSDGDIIQRSAYDKSISENFKRFRHFKNHDFNLVPGVPKELIKEGDYLFMISQLILDSDVGRNTYAEYKAGAIKEHSHGFITIKEHFDEKQKANIITEGFIMEGSSLTAWGANENTPTAYVKSFNDIIEYLSFAEKALKSNEFTDDYLLKVEAKVKEVSKILSLKNGTQQGKPLDNGTEQITEKELIEAINKFKLFY